MRENIVAGNWKMNMDREAGLALVKEIVQGRKDEHDQVKVIIAPPFPFLADLNGICAQNDGVHLAAQNCHHEDKGAYTGEVSAAQLRSFACDYVIVGHSERRQYFSEDDVLVRKKILKIIEHGMSPIYCCGESLADRESGNHFKVVERQLTTALLQLTVEQLKNVIVAYEPVWAIGTGMTATPEQAQEMHAFIRSRIASVSEKVAQSIPILYGGSVKPGNAKELFSQEDIDGGLIGGAALNAGDFLQLTLSF